MSFLLDRGGIGMEELKKRKAEEKLENFNKKLQMKQHMEQQSLVDFRYGHIMSKHIMLPTGTATEFIFLSLPLPSWL